MKSALLAGLALAVIGCAKHPSELKRVEQLDSECEGKGVAYTYPLSTGSAVSDKATKVGCFAPLGAWTDESDANKGGTRKILYELREKEKTTMLCCKN
jgi:hypothetical protein